MTKRNEVHRTERLYMSFTPVEWAHLTAELQRRYPYVLIHDAARALLLKTYLDQEKDHPHGRDAQD